MVCVSMVCAWSFEPYPALAGLDGVRGDGLRLEFWMGMNRHDNLWDAG